jgi:hypothetical protein
MLHRNLWHRDLIESLKFQVVVACAFSAVAAAVVTTYYQVRATQADTARLLLQQNADARESTARLIGTKIQTLHFVLASVASAISPQLLKDRGSLVRLIAQ